MRVSAGAGLLLISAICAVLYKYETNTDIRDANGRQMYDQQTTTSKNTSLGPLYNPRHRWVFLPDQRPDEAWIFKQFDTRDGVAKCTFHNSFPDPCHIDEPDDTHGRRSVEFRFILTFPRGGGARPRGARL